MVENKSPAPQLGQPQSIKPSTLAERMAMVRPSNRVAPPRLSPLADLFAEFEAEAAELNQVSDSINETIKTIETRLVSANAGIECFLEQPLQESDPERHGVTDANFDGHEWSDVYRYLLGFGKAPGDGWRLLVKTVQSQTGYDHEADESYGSETALKTFPLLEASRELRIRAIELIPDLVEALRNEAKRRVELIKASRNKLP